jgi:hypothetical protein
MAKKNGSTTDEKAHVVITLRIDPAAKKKLHAYCLTRSREEGKRVSYNQAIIEMIEGARASKRAAAAG